MQCDFILSIVKRIMLYTLFVAFNIHCNFSVFDLANLFIGLNVDKGNGKSHYRNAFLFLINLFTFATLFAIL